MKVTFQLADLSTTVITILAYHILMKSKGIVYVYVLLSQITPT